mmetsp:Transcript_16787/g.48224  ORF Transcript_16787/g.48224 Transcript_16787/m.48224 type:complete len:612 (-) Transcript_16787:478-2313(-)
MPSAVGDGRGCQLTGHGGKTLQLGRDFAGIVVAAAQDGNIVQGQARLDARLEEPGAGTEVVDGLPLEMESLPQHPDVGLDVQTEDVVSTPPAQRLLELRPIEPAPIEPAHIADGAKAVAVIDGYELEVVRVLRLPTAQEVGRVAIGVEDAYVQDGDLVHLVDTELGGAEIVHGVIGMDKVLEAPDLLPEDGGMMGGRDVDPATLGSGRREGEGMRPDGRPALAELEPRSVGVEGRMPRLGQGGGGNSREASVIEQVGRHLPDARLAGADAGPHPVVEAAVEAESGAGVDLGGGGDVAAGVVGGVRFLVGRLEDGDLGLVGVVQEVRAARPVEDEVGLEADGESPAGLAHRSPQAAGRHVEEGRRNAHVVGTEGTETGEAGEGRGTGRRTAAGVAPRRLLDLEEERLARSVDAGIVQRAVVGQLPPGRHEGTKVQPLGGGGDAEVLSKAVLDVLDGRPGADRQRSLLALLVGHVADEDPQVGTLDGAGGTVGSAVVLATAAGRPPGPVVAPTSTDSAGTGASGAVRQDHDRDGPVGIPSMIAEAHDKCCCCVVIVVVVVVVVVVVQMIRLWRRSFFVCVMVVVGMVQMAWKSMILLLADGYAEGVGRRTIPR